MMSIKGPVSDGIQREPQLGLREKEGVSPSVLQPTSRFNAHYFPDISATPPTPSTYVLWNNAGTLYFGSIPVGAYWSDDLTYLYPTSTGRGIRIQNAAGTEESTIVRSDTTLTINSGVGGEFAIQRAASTYIQSGANLVNVQNASLKQVDSESYNLTIENDAGTAAGLISRSNTLFILNAGVGGHLSFQVAGVPYIQTAANLVEIQSASLKQIDSETYPITIENNAGTETGTISRSDTELIINSGVGGELALQRSSVSYLVTSSGYVNIQNASLRQVDSETYNFLLENDAATNDVNLYCDANGMVIRLSDAAGLQKIQVVDSTPAIVLTIDSDGKITGPVDDVILIANHDVIARLGDAAGTYAFKVQTNAPTDIFKVLSTGVVQVMSGDELQSFNVGNTENGRIYRDDTTYHVDSGTGGVLSLEHAGTSYVLTSAGFVNVQNASLKQVDSETYNLLLENDAATNDVNLYCDANGMVIRLSDAAGAQKVQIMDSAPVAVCTIDSDGTITGALSYIYLDSSQDIDLDLGDAAGARYFRVRDSGSVDMFRVNSDGLTEILAGGNFYLYNAGNTEYAKIYRNDSYLFIDSFTGALGTVFPLSQAIGMGTSTPGGPAGRMILDVLNVRGSDTDGGRIEEGAYHFMDDFHSGAMEGYWDLLTSATGSTTAENNRKNGWIKIETGAVMNDFRGYDWGGTYTFVNTARPTMQVLMNLDSIADARVRIGLIGANANDFIWFEFDTSNGVSPGNWHAMIGNDSGGGGSQDGDTGIAATTNEVVLRFEMTADNIVTFYIDGVLAYTSSTTAAVPTAYIQPYIYVETLTGSAKNIDMDYYQIWEDRK